MAYDAFGFYRHEIPTLNVKKLVEAWEWASLKNGQDGEPAWYQAQWATPIYTDGFRRVVEGRSGQQIEEDCGTAFCIAGYVTREHAVKSYGGFFMPEDINVDGEKVNLGFQNNWSSAGAAVLGITPAEASQLFSGENTLEDIKRRMNTILAHRGEEIRVG